MSSILASEDPDWRFWVTLLVALLGHALVIIGIRFQTAPPRELYTPTLRVSLVATPNRIQPDEQTPEAGADHLGGGMPTEQSLETQSPTPAEKTLSDQHSEAGSVHSPVEQLPSSESAVQAPSAKPEEKPSPPDSVEVIAATETSEPAARPNEEIQHAAKNRPSATELMRQARLLARRSPGSALPISRGDAPKSYGASSRFSVLEAYIDDWVRKVQDWGSRNFPPQARKQGLKGQLRLSVVLRYDGRIQAITLIETSGHPFLDQAAVDIVELAAPYAPFPEQLRASYGDFLTIDRNWQFVQGNRLTSR